MDIKQELDDVIEADEVYNAEWQNYKREFEETDLFIKTERYQEPRVGLENNESKINDASKVFPIKIEKCYGKPLISQINTKMTPSSNIAPYYAFSPSGCYVTKKIISSKEVDPFLVPCGDFRSGFPFPAQVAEIILKRIRLFERNFVCGVCCGVFATKSEQELHKVVHAVSTNCVIKRKSIYKSKHTKKLDVLNANSKNNCRENRFKCSDCDYVGKYLSRLKKHKMSHTNDKPIKCGECSYSCVYYSDMKKHLMIHTGEKPYKCEQCPYSCIHSGDLKKHSMIHSGEKPYKCDGCSFSCTLPGYMRKHKLIHTGKKPFKCDECDYAGMHSGDMRKHKMIHSGERPPKCDKCDYSSINLDRMKNHKMIHSGERGRP